MDVMLGSYPRDNFEIRGESSEDEIYLSSNRQNQVINQNNGKIRSNLNTNLSGNNGLTLETSGLINSEISSEISGKLEIDLNCQILEVINSAVAEKVLPSTENAVRPTKTTSNTKWDLRSDGPHPSQIGQIAQE